MKAEENEWNKVCICVCEREKESEREKWIYLDAFRDARTIEQIDIRLQILFDIDSSNDEGCTHRILTKCEILEREARAQSRRKISPVSVDPLTLNHRCSCAYSCLVSSKENNLVSNWLVPGHYRFWQLVNAEHRVRYAWKTWPLNEHRYDSLTIPTFYIKRYRLPFDSSPLESDSPSFLLYFFTFQDDGCFVNYAVVRDRTSVFEYRDTIIIPR